MPASGDRVLSGHPDMYWVIRRRELAHMLHQLNESYQETRQAQQVLLSLTETAKLNEPEWEDAMASAMQALRKARSFRTRVRKTVYNHKDTLRIRTNLREACPQDMHTLLDTATKFVEFMEGLGY